MKKFLSCSMFICLVTVLVLRGPDSGTHAQSKSVNGPVAAPAKAETTPVKAASGVDELIALLPASDGIATINVGRAFNELFPRLSELGVNVDHLSNELEEFIAKTGIDLAKAQNAVIGLNLVGVQASPVVIIQGVDVDNKKIEGAIKAYRADYKTEAYKDKQIFRVNSKVKSPSAGPLSVKTDETVLVALGQQRLVFGDLGSVKNVIDIQSGASKNGVTPFMVDALKETRSSSLIRFALNLPENLRQEAMNQGDLFKSVATIKVILGTFDIANDFSLSLDTVLRTTSQTQAAELEGGLKSLITLLKGFFGGNEKKMELYGQLIDQIKIGSKVNDVSLSINIPRSVMEQLTKKTASVDKK